MSDKKRKNRLWNMIFVEKTITAKDFREPDLLSLRVPERQQRVKHVKEQEYKKPKYLESLQEYKAEPVTYALFMRPHPILGRNPSDIQQPFDKPKDEGRKEAQMKRPRLIISPGLPLDAIDDDEIRNLVVEDTYLSNKKKADSIVVGDNISRIRAPLGHTYATPRPCLLPKRGPPVAIKEFRMESRYWDLNNLRGHCDPTEKFWMEKAEGRLK